MLTSVNVRRSYDPCIKLFQRTEGVVSYHGGEEGSIYYCVFVVGIAVLCAALCISGYDDEMTPGNNMAVPDRTAMSEIGQIGYFRLVCCKCV